MGFDKQYQNRPGPGAGNSSNEISTNVVTNDGFLQGPSNALQVKQEISDLEDIIMEGDIILNIHADGAIEAGSRQEMQIQNADCAGHSHLTLHQDETLLKIGDKFDSHKDFVSYLNSHANRWCFYYKCTESENADTENEAYTYSCLYLRDREYKKKLSKKRANSKTDCPSKVKLRRWPDQYLTVTYVCNHHDHELTKDGLDRLKTNKKMSPYVKDIIMDLLALEVNVGKIRKFVEMETDIKMSLTFFTEMEKKMKSKNEERHISDKRLKELSDKMAVVDELFSGDEDETETDVQNRPIKRPRLSSPEIIYNEEDETHIGRSIKDRIQFADSEQNSGDYHTEEGQEATEWNEDEQITEIETLDEDEGEYQEVTEQYQTEETNETQPADESQQNISQYENVVLQDEFGNIINDESIIILQQDENGLVQGDNGTIGYFDGEQLIYLPDPSQAQEGQNDQQPTQTTEAPDNTADESGQSDPNKSGHSLVPVFNVYMKNGNVTGFISKDNVGKGNSESTDQTQELGEMSSLPTGEIMQPLCDITTSNATQEFICGDTYTKHEYIHRYNIDHYMSKAQFPKYIDTLAKKTRTDVMQMLSKVYNEKAMFKMTTTQKGKEGNTKIFYLTDVRRKGKYKMSDEEKMKKDKLGQYITDILILKERVKYLKRENEVLITRNKYLEEVALRLAKTTESN